MDFDRRALLNQILPQFRLSLDGIHGPNHWARVRRHGLRVGLLTGADLLVVELFAFLHDSQRRNEDEDPLHGARGAEYAASLNGQAFQLDQAQLQTLCYAIRHHSDGLTSDDATLQTCWDADRLDLGRCGIRPRAKYLSAVAAEEIQSAWLWSQQCADAVDLTLWEFPDAV